MARKNKRNQLRKPQRGSSGGGEPPVPQASAGGAIDPAEGGQTAGAAQPATYGHSRPCGRFHVRPVVASQPAPCPARTPRSRSIGALLPLGPAADRDHGRFMLVLLIVGSIVLRGLLQA